ncbi:MAG: hypothetical protein ACRDHO_06200 [Actinomycetota bacterium]
MVPIVEGIARTITVFALATLAAAAAIWWLIHDRGATGPGMSATLLVWAIVLAFPGAMLLTVAIALRLLAGLPDRLAEVPERAREHASSLGHLASEARRVRRRGWVRSGWSVVRLWRAAAASKDVIGIAAPVAFLFTPMTLLLGIIATAAGLRGDPVRRDCPARPALHVAEPATPTPSSRGRAVPYARPIHEGEIKCRTC